MDRPRRDLDALLSEWQYNHGEVSARRSVGRDGRPLLLLRIDMGVLQLEVEGRPDGSRPDGEDTYLAAMRSRLATDENAFELDSDHCIEIDREFVQYYHRRIAWLALREFDKVVADADHTLELMDFSALHAPDQDWIEEHEQYRPFVLFHRTQAAALAELQHSEPEAAVARIDDGIARLTETLAEYQSPKLEGDFADGDAADFVDRLDELRESIQVEYDLQTPLNEQLADAIAREQYELAAELRDRIATRSKQDSGRRR